MVILLNVMFSSASAIMHKKSIFLNTIPCSKFTPSSRLTLGTVPRLRGAQPRHRGSIPHQQQEIVLFSKTSTRATGPIQRVLWALTQPITKLYMRQIIHRNPVPRLLICGATPSHPLSLSRVHIHYR